MSDSNEFMLKRISELEKAVQDANGESAKWKARFKREQEAGTKLKAESEPAVKDARDALEKATAERDALLADRDTWKSKAESSPTEWKTKAEELQGKLQARDAADAWSKVVGEELAPKVSLEKLWAELDYKPGDTPPTPEEITEQLKAARESVPYLFKTVADTPTETPRGSQTPATKPPLKETVAAGRGAPDKTSSRVTVSKAQLQDPKWKLDPLNKEMLSDATKRGVLDIVD